jgi:putative endonuclease
MLNAGKRRIAEKYGRDAEAAVISDWQSRGFDLLAQRQRTKSGEVDIVVADRETLVFVEVKARESFAAAAYAVAPRQQARLLQAAESLLALNQNWERPTIRFDVALVCHGEIEHIEDAIRYN